MTDILFIALEFAPVQTTGLHFARYSLRNICPNTESDPTS